MAKKGTAARGGGGTGSTRRGGKTVRRGQKGSTAAAGRGEKSKGRAPARAHPGTRGAADKVGSNRRKAVQFGGRNDFGVPARRATPSGRAPDSAFGLPRNENGRSGAAGDRTHGVGTAPSNPGSGSGGDVDTDYIGVGVSPVAQAPPTGVTGGRDAATGTSADLASAPDRPARGRNQKGRVPPGAHGAAATRTFDTVNHTGEDANTIQRTTNTDTAGTAMAPKGPDDPTGTPLTGDEGTTDTTDIAARTPTTKGRRR